MSASSAPTIKAWLLTQLQARAGLAGVQVVWDDPEEEEERELIRLGDITSEEEWVALPAIRRAETYEIDVMISVISASLDDPQVTATRALALLDEISQLLRADVRLANQVQVAALTRWKLSSARNSEKGWREASIEAAIQVKNRI